MVAGIACKMETVVHLGGGSRKFLKDKRVGSSLKIKQAST